MNVPTTGQIVRVRTRHWLVGDVETSVHGTLVLFKWLQVAPLVGKLLATSELSSRSCGSARLNHTRPGCPPTQIPIISYRPQGHMKSRATRFWSLLFGTQNY